MHDFRYIDDVVTLTLDQETCIGCGGCAAVCPHRVLVMDGRDAAGKTKARIRDRNGCIECGACALQCPVAAVTVTPGVGCASYIIQTWLKGKKAASC